MLLTRRGLLASLLAAAAASVTRLGRARAAPAPAPPTPRPIKRTRWIGHY